MGCPHASPSRTPSRARPERGGRARLASEAANDARSAGDEPAHYLQFLPYPQRCAVEPGLERRVQPLDPEFEGAPSERAARDGAAAAEADAQRERLRPLGARAGHLPALVSLHTLALTQLQDVHEPARVRALDLA